MLKQRFFLLAFCSTLVFSFALSDARAQEKTVSPDLSVEGVKLGNRVSAKAFLGVYQARISDEGRPVYYFYNRFADQVMKLTGLSMEDRFFITEIEVYRVGKSYREVHFVADKVGHFRTEKDVFIGYRQSKASAITGIPNVDGKDMTGPKTVVKKIGEPTEQSAEGEREILIYRLPEIELTDENGKAAKFSYRAEYEFNENKLKKFTLKISPKP